MIVWIWDAIGPAASACGVADTADAARRCVSSLISSGRAHAAHVEQATLVLGTTLSYDYCPTGRGWHARLDGGRLTWTPAGPVYSK